ncbi:MAG: type II secretion system protein [Candidatus Omnitrophica bacterium]|nr:type II secretion system protein [Candidatus Omnitrophota bacterium]
MRGNLNKKSGFTLLELVIVIALVGILALFLAEVIRRGVESWYFVMDKEELALQTPYVLTRLVRELRTANTVTSALGNTIVFKDYQNNTFNYALFGNVLYRNGSPLLDGVTNFSLQYYPSSSNIRMVTISLQRSKGAYSLSLQSGAKLRK